MTDPSESRTRNQDQRERDRAQKRDEVREKIRTRLNDEGERSLQRSARERVEDRKAGRAERGLFTGRGRKASSKRTARDERDTRSPRRSRWFGGGEDEAPRPRTGAKRTIMRSIRLLPRYVRLLLGLIGDRRVSRWDRFFVLAAAAYIISPLDFIPDVIPFLGEIDDLFLLMLALQRLVGNAGQRVLLDHWKGNPDDLSPGNIARVVSAAGFFLPNRLKQKLRKMVS